MASMYPGIAAQDATNVRCARSIFKMTPVTGYRFAAAKERHARVRRKRARRPLRAPDLRRQSKSVETTLDAADMNVRATLLIIS
jgi:hypothetical protein